MNPTANKIADVEFKVCKSCAQYWEGECRAYALWHSVEEWNHRKSGERSCQHFDIPLETKAFIEMNNQAFVILEGVCPTCGEELKMKSIGGIASEMEFWNIPEGIEPTIWNEPYPPDSCGQAILGIEWVCPHKHVHYVEKTRSGDWSV